MDQRLMPLRDSKFHGNLLQRQKRRRRHYVSDVVAKVGSWWYLSELCSATSVKQPSAKPFPLFFPVPLRSKANNKTTNVKTITNQLNTLIRQHILLFYIVF